MLREDMGVMDGWEVMRTTWADSVLARISSTYPLAAMWE